MTDKVKHTVTIEVEADAIGPTQAIRQALDWARDTESGPAVITVQASNLSPLRAAVADGRVSQLFTGPVTTPGPICQKPAGLASWRFDELANKWLAQATAPHLCGVACPETLKLVGHELQRVTREAVEAAPGPSCQKPAGVDPDKVRELAGGWRRLAESLGAVNVAFYSEKAAELRTDIKRLRHCAGDLEALTNDR